MRSHWTHIQGDLLGDGQVGTFMAPRVLRDVRKRAVVYCHGAGSSALELYGTYSGLPAVNTLIRRIVDEGYPVVAPTMTQTWGNATTIARMDAAVAYARDYLGASGDDPIVAGGSHGGACALTYASVRSCAAMLGVIPAVDIQALRVSNFLSQRATIDAAFGVTYPAALPVGKNPYTTTLTIPKYMSYAGNDGASENIALYAAGHPNTTIRNIGNTGHSDASIAATDFDEMMDFLRVSTRGY